jgi:hypothetical protein
MVRGQAIRGMSCAPKKLAGLKAIGMVVLGDVQEESDALCGRIEHVGDGT